MAGFPSKLTRRTEREGQKETALQDGRLIEWVKQHSKKICHLQGVSATCAYLHRHTSVHMHTWQSEIRWRGSSTLSNRTLSKFSMRPVPGANIEDNVPQLPTCVCLFSSAKKHDQLLASFAENDGPHESYPS